MHHKEIHISDRKSRSKGKSRWEKRDVTGKTEKKPVSKTAQDHGQKKTAKPLSLHGCARAFSNCLLTSGFK